MRRLLLALAILLPLWALSSTPATSAPTCINNDCAVGTAGLSYHGGHLLSAPAIYLIRFSTSASSLQPATGYPTHTFSPTAPNLAGAVDATVDNAATNWWMKEYQTPAIPLKPGAYIHTVTIVNSALATQTTVSDAAIELALTLTSGTAKLPISANAIDVVVMRDYQKVTSVFGSGCPYRSTISETSPSISANVPYIALASYAAGTSCVYASPYTPFGNMVSLLGASLVSTMLNPNVSTGWVSYSSARDPGSACIPNAYQPVTTPVSYNGTSYPLVRVWSRLDQLCASTRLTPLLSLSSSGTKVHVTLRVQGHPVVGAPITAHRVGGIVVTAFTNAQGAVSIAMPSGASPIVRVIAPAKGALNIARASLQFARSVTTTTRPVTTTTKPSTPTTTPIFVPKSTKILPQAPTIVAANQLFSFATFVSPAHITDITISAPGYSYTTKTSSNGEALLKAKAPLGSTRFSITTSSPYTTTSVVIRAVPAPTLTLTELSTNSLRVHLAQGSPLANASVRLYVNGSYTTVVTNSSGTVLVTFPPYVSTLYVLATYSGSATTLSATSTITLVHK